MKLPVFESKVVAVMGALFFAGFLAYMRLAHPVVAFMDSLRFLGYFDDSMSGRRSVWATWNQGEHHGLLPQALVYFNARLFHYRVFFATLLSGVVIGLTGIVLSYNFARTLKEESISMEKVNRIVFLAVCFITFAALFSLSNWELYCVDVGAALFAKNLSFILYWIALDRVLRSPSSSVLKASLLAGAPLIILLVAFGWAYNFAVTSLICIFWCAPSSASMRSRFALSASIVLSITLYVVGGRLTAGGHYLATEPELFIAIKNIATGYLLAISSVFVDREAVAFYGIGTNAQYAIACLTLALALWLLVQNFLQRRNRSIIPTALILYALVDGCSVAIARGRFDPALASASRYFMDLSLLIVGMAWSAVLLSGPRRVTKAMTLAVTIIFLIGQSLTAKYEWYVAPYRHDLFMRMMTATLSGAKTTEDATLLQQPLDSARRGSQVQSEYGLGPFRDIKK
jgi:hypothetical protein